MTVIIILITLALQRYFGLREKIHKIGLFDRYLDAIHPSLQKLGMQSGYLRIIGIMAPILIIVALLNLLFMYFWPLYFIFSILVLLYCLNARDLKAQLSPYFQASLNQQMDVAQEEANKFLETETVRSRVDMSRQITREIFIKSQVEVFSLLFWFIALGPFGAVMYHVTYVLHLYAKQNRHQLSNIFVEVDVIQNLLDWIPVRLVSFTYALIGHFGPVFNLLIERLSAGLQENKNLIVDSGMIALSLNPVDATHADISESYQALGLVDRALWTWMIVLAVLQFTAWFF